MVFLFEVTTPHITYAALGGFVVFFGMFSLFIRERLYIGEAIWAFLFGVIIGPYGANVWNPREWGNGDEKVINTVTLELTRVVLAIGVFSIGIELPKQYMKRHWKSLAYLLGPVMTWGWFVSAALIYALIPNLSFLSALVIAACLTPTDPILAAAVIGGRYADKHVPAHLRHLLAAESGCNDGAAFPFLFIGIYLVLDNDDGHAVRDWFLLLWLYQIILGTVIGTLIGFGFRYLMKFCERKELIDRQSYVAQYVSLALLTIGVCTLLGSDDLLAAFCCGTAFAWDGFFNRQTEEAVFSSVIDLLFNIASFVFVGAWMPFGLFNSEELSLAPWRLIVLALLVLLLRRLPIMIALYKFIPDIKTFREAVFSGHFGPIGIGGVFISTLAAERLPHPHHPPKGQAEMLAATIQPVVAFMVLCSVLVHGLSIPSFSLGRRVHSVRREWSRRSTTEVGGGPEWAAQIRRLRPGEKPEVNRDVERDGATEANGSPVDTISGDISAAAKREDDKELTGPERAKAHEREAAPVEDVNNPDTKEKEPAQPPPDGDEILSEWREGSDRIIERRAGPGEEVEVEVQRNAFVDDAPRMTSIFRGHGAHVHNVAREYLAAVRHKAEEAAAAVSPSEEKDASPEVTPGPSGKSVTSPDAATSRQSSQAASDDTNAVPDDNDAGWLSDEPETISVSSSKATSPRIAAPPRRGRRRHSMRRSLHTARAAAHADNEPPADEDDERGRQAARRLASIHASPNPSRHASASPARSIRWADDGDDGADSPRKVAFELPQPVSSRTTSKHSS